MPASALDLSRLVTQLQCIARLNIFSDVLQSHAFHEFEYSVKRTEHLLAQPSVIAQQGERWDLMVGYASVSFD